MLRFYEEVRVYLPPSLKSHPSAPSLKTPHRAVDSTQRFLEKDLQTKYFARLSFVHTMLTLEVTPMTLSKVLLVRISENLLSELRKTAQHRNQTMSSLLRHLIENLIKDSK